jgi:hypothetical protein
MLQGVHPTRLGWGKGSIVRGVRLPWCPEGLPGHGRIWTGAAYTCSHDHPPHRWGIQTLGVAVCLVKSLNQSDPQGAARVPAPPAPSATERARDVESAVEFFGLAQHFLWTREQRGEEGAGTGKTGDGGLQAEYPGRPQLLQELIGHHKKSVKEALEGLVLPHKDYAQFLHGHLDERWLADNPQEAALRRRKAKRAKERAMG